MANTPNTGTLKLTGIKSAGSTITASKGTLSDVDGMGVLSYQWMSTNVQTSAVSMLSANSSYKLTTADLDSSINTISLVASYIDAKGTVESKLITNVWATLNQDHTGTITIAGSPTVSSVLTAKNNISDADGLNTFQYSWARDNVVIANQSASTYKLSTADIGRKITSTITYTDKHGYPEKEVSKATPVVTTSIKTSDVNDLLTATSTTPLIGGLGADTFAYTTTSLYYTITDFNHSQGDKIDLSAIDADDGILGNNAFTTFSLLDSAPTTTFALIGTSLVETTPSAAGKLWFNADLNTLYGSTDFDIAPEFAIRLVGVTVVEATDFTY